MKKIILILIVLILLPSILAQEFNDYGNLVIETKLNSSLNIEKLSSNYELDYVYANLTLFPRNTEFQTSNTIIKSNPDAQITEQEDFVLYYWNNPKQDKLEFNLESKINSNINFKEINEKVKFPILDVDLNGYEKYLIATESVTSNDLEIKKLASELAEGEDDLYNVVWKIALWTNQNINYSLETLTAEVSQNATWVLENRKGVCDELTSLFVAMLRSLKIPARFAVGQSYTNMINGFGNHAWAEVYFPSYGWVAFDPTYGQ
ncbi:MAG: transglutaminase-like domain-containing protein, partial [Nanoarchaeota archaeon]